MSQLARCAVGYAGGLTAALLLLPASDAPGPSPAAAPAPDEASAPPPRPEQPPAAPDAAVEALCGTCHTRPGPDVLSRRSWAAIVSEMFLIIGAPSGVVGDVTRADAVRYFESRAPAHLPLRPDCRDSDPGPVRFQESSLGLEELRLPAVANVRLQPFSHPRLPDLVVSEMRTGRVLVGRIWSADPTPRTVGRVRHPGHTEVVDLDRDGTRELLVADLGRFYPSNATEGAVVWLRPAAGGGTEPGVLEPVHLASGLGRVADARAADLDGDEDLDLVVGAFGWRSGGALLWYENRTTSWAEPVFVGRLLDPRAGVVSAPVVDLDRDGRPDVVALISQEHEVVVAYTNAGGGEFESRELWRAPHPKWGHTGLEPTDLDGDGDTDLLFTSGDTFDTAADVLLPFHGVWWLENRGGGVFWFWELGSLYAAHRAEPADLDGDGDLDVAASGFLGDPAREWQTRARLPTVVWFEQRPGQTFVRHVLRTGALDHATLAAGDWDDDGDVDLVVGSYLWPDDTRPGTWPGVLVYENLRLGGGR